MSEGPERVVPLRHRVSVCVREREREEREECAACTERTMMVLPDEGSS